MQWTDHLRGALLAVALIAHGIYAIPFPEVMDAGEMEKSFRKKAVRLWRGRLATLGVQVEESDLSAGWTRVTTDLKAIERTLKVPFKPVFLMTRTNQNWALFVGATTRPERIVVEIRRAGRDDWEPIERRLDPCCNWREEQFRYRRIRGAWDGLRVAPRPAYRYLVRWIARHAFADFDDAEEVRIYMERGYSTYPWRPNKPELETRHEHTFRRDQPL